MSASGVREGVDTTRDLQQGCGGCWGSIELWVGAKFSLFFFFGGSGVWTQSLTLARQMLYHLNHSHQPFTVGYFSRQGLTNYVLILLISVSWVARIIGVRHWWLAISFLWVCDLRDAPEPSLHLIYFIVFTDRHPLLKGGSNFSFVCVCMCVFCPQGAESSMDWVSDIMKTAAVSLAPLGGPGGQWLRGFVSGNLGFSVRIYRMSDQIQ
jgi:hypothetical protein